MKGQESREIKRNRERERDSIMAFSWSFLCFSSLALPHVDHLTHVHYTYINEKNCGRYYSYNSERLSIYILLTKFPSSSCSDSFLPRHLPSWHPIYVPFITFSTHTLYITWCTNNMNFFFFFSSSSLIVCNTCKVFKNYNLQTRYKDQIK